MKGYRGIFLIGFTLFTIGSALCGMAPTIGLLIAFRMLQAVGGAIIAALGSVMVTSYLGSELRGQALGLVAMFTMLGVAMGPVIGGFLTSALSWRFIFLVNIPVGVIAILLGIFVIPRLPAIAKNSKLDIPGVIFIFIALASLILGLNMMQGDNSSTGILVLIIFAVFLSAFIIREKRAKEPLANLSVFRNAAYSIQNIAILILQMGVAGVMFLMPFYLEIVKGMSTGESGALLLALPVGNILTAPIAGKISDVIGTKKPIIFGFIIAIAGLFLLSTLTVNIHEGGIAVFLFILGAGAGIAYAPLNSAIMGESPEKEQGMTSGLIKMMTNLGSSLGVTFSMLIFGLVLGPEIALISAHTIKPQQLIPGFDIAFLFCMAMQIIALVLMFLVKNKESAGNSEPVI